jgi:hypothetical protein
MNLLEYRAMKEAESQQAEGGIQNAQTEQVSTEPVQPVVQETTQTEPAQPDVGTEAETQAQPESTPQVYEINGEQVSIDELQRGYLRQSDYTRKTQDIARKERELATASQVLERVQQDPELAQQVGYNPEQAKYDSLQAELFDLRLQQEVQTLSTKYADFDANEVFNFALSRNMDNIEDAYLLNKQYKSINVPPQQNSVSTQPQTIATNQVDVEALKAQIRAELLAEQNTGSLISGGGSAPTPEADVQLTPDELKVAKAFRMTPDEYVKWRQ